MLKNNYRAWKIDATGFNDKLSDSEKLQYFAKYAVLAPSGHNTQPWQLAFKQNGLMLSIHPDHHLSIDGSGLLSVEPYISIGTFLEVFSLAAKGFGYDVSFDITPEKKQIAKITLGKKVKAEPALLDAITHRVSNRHHFKTQALPRKLIDELTKKKHAGTKITVITKRSDIEFIAERTERGITSIMSKPLYRKELSLWVRNNQTKKFDGMPGFTHGFKTIPALLSKAAIKHAPAGGPQAKKSGELIRHSGALFIVSCTNNERLSFINAGRIFSQICVLAQNNGIASSALGAAVLDPETREEVKKQFGIKDRPVYILRLGHAVTPSRHSPRWPLERLTVQTND